MNCHDIKTEIAKTRSIQQEIEKPGSLTAKRCWDFWEISVSVTGLPKMMRGKSHCPPESADGVTGKNCR